MHSLQNQWGFHRDALADRHLISSAEKSSVMQCSREQVCSLTSTQTHTHRVCMLAPVYINYAEGPETSP